ncbi:hypothetical protein [Pseudomonas sp. 2995-1]|nr:hypothetical protein [Pseudomonas sp. 2995-1]
MLREHKGDAGSEQPFVATYTANARYLNLSAGVVQHDYETKPAAH